MPKLSHVQEIAINVVDFIYFYDVVALTAFQATGENKAVFQQLNCLIDDVIAERDLSGERVAIYKHFLLCNIEMGATFNVDRDVIVHGELSRGDRYQMVRQQHEKALELLLAEVTKAGFKRNEFEADVVYIMDKSAIEERPNYICFGLVGVALSFDFCGCIAAHVYRKFLDIEILRTDKNNIKNEYDYVDNEHVFLRAMLFIEFEIMRNKFFQKHNEQGYMIKYEDQKIPESRVKKEQEFLLMTYNFYRKAIDSDFPKIYQFNLLDKLKVEEYLSKIDVHFCHNRYFSENNSKWMSLFGLWHLIYNKSVNQGLSIYDDVKNEGTCSDLAEIELKNDFGLTIKARNLYNYYSKYENLFYFIGLAAAEIRKESKQGFENPCLTYAIKYHPNLSEHLLKIFDSFDKDIGYGK